MVPWIFFLVFFNLQFTSRDLWMRPLYSVLDVRAVSHCNPVVLVQSCFPWLGCVWVGVLCSLPISAWPSKSWINLKFSEHLPIFILPLVELNLPIPNHLSVWCSDPTDPGVSGLKQRERRKHLRRWNFPFICCYLYTTLKPSHHMACYLFYWLPGQWTRLKLAVIHIGLHPSTSEVSRAGLDLKMRGLCKYVICMVQWFFFQVVREETCLQGRAAGCLRGIPTPSKLKVPSVPPPSLLQASSSHSRIYKSNKNERLLDFSFERAALDFLV